MVVEGKSDMVVYGGLKFGYFRWYSTTLISEHKHSIVTVALRQLPIWTDSASGRAPLILQEVGSTIFGMLKFWVYSFRRKDTWYLHPPIYL